MSKVVFVGEFLEGGKKVFIDRCKGKYEYSFIKTDEEFYAQTDAEYYVLRGLRMDEAHISKLSTKAKLFQRWGVGYETVDIKAAGKHGITVAIATGINSQPVSEIAVLLMLASYRRLPQLIARSKSGSGKKDDIAADTFLLSGKQVGIIGLGHIGKKVASNVRGFGTSVVYYDIVRPTPQEEKELGVRYVPLDELLRTSDIITLHVPLFDSTRHLIDEAAFEKMNPSALLINTARGGVVDTNALVRALENHRIWGAGLDVTDPEPLPADHPLLKFPNVIVTPHNGGNTKDNDAKMSNYIMDNIDLVEAGGKPKPDSIVNAEYLVEQ